MMRLIAAAIAALALAAPAGADVFRIVPTAPANSPAFLPSAQAPNTPGSVLLTPDLLVPPVVPQTRTYDQLLALWQRYGAQYGVQWQVLAAINKVESNFGRNMGPSSAGAIGWMQFMPSTWERWGVDANGDGVADPWSPDDAIAAAARYLAASGGATDISRAVFSYNHAQWYVDEVMQLAQLFGNGGVDATFSLDRMQVSLDRARAKVVHANQQLLQAERDLRALSGREDALRRHEAVSPLLSDQLSLDRRATQLGVQRAAAQSSVDALRGELEQAQSDLSLAKDRSLASSFAPAAGSLLAAAGLRRPVRLPGRRRALARLGLAPPPRLPGGRHRSARGHVRSTRWRTRPSCAPGATPTRAAASASRSTPLTVRSGRTATSPTSTRR